MRKANEIIHFLEKWAPLDLQDSWDKSGYQVNFHCNEVESVTLAMDVTPRVIDEAIKNNSQLILTHHPFIFQGIENLDLSTIRGRMIEMILENKITVYSSHTNLDKAEDGVNDQWGEMLDLRNVEVLDEIEGIGIVGEVDLDLKDLLSRLKNLGIYSFKGYGMKKDWIGKVAILGGSGSDYITKAKDKGAALLITGDMTHHKGQEAYEKEIMVLDIGHFHSEKYILNRIKEYLSEVFPDLSIFISENCDFVFDLE